MMADPPKNKGGRPRKNISIERVEELAGNGASMEDVARAVGITRSKFSKREDLREAYHKGESEARVRATKRLFEIGMAGGGNAVTALIYFLKIKGVNPDKIDQARSAQKVVVEWAGENPFAPPAGDGPAAGSPAADPVIAEPVQAGDMRATVG